MFIFTHQVNVKVDSCRGVSPSLTSLTKTAESLLSDIMSNSEVKRSAKEMQS